MNIFRIDPLNSERKLKIINIKESNLLSELQNIVNGKLDVAFHFNDENNCVLYINDEGLLNNVECFFQVIDKKTSKALTQPLAGKGIIVGTDKNGNSTAPNIDVLLFNIGFTFISRNEPNEFNKICDYYNDKGIYIERCETK